MKSLMLMTLHYNGENFYKLCINDINYVDLTKFMIYSSYRELLIYDSI